jgi:hypothetical protein
VRSVTLPRTAGGVYASRARLPVAVHAEARRLRPRVRLGTTGLARRHPRRAGPRGRRRRPRHRGLPTEPPPIATRRTSGSVSPPAAPSARSSLSTRTAKAPPELFLHIGPEGADVPLGSTRRTSTGHARDECSMSSPSAGPTTSSSTTYIAKRPPARRQYPVAEVVPRQPHILHVAAQARHAPVHGQHGAEVGPAGQAGPSVRVLVGEATEGRARHQAFP